MATTSRTASSRGSTVWRVVFLLLLLYFFLVAIELFSGSMKMLGAEMAQRLFSGLSHPFAGLAVGVLATVLVQSSSVTTSTIVALVGSGQIGVAAAVPMVMGANVGTSITNSLVALGHVGRKEEFRRAFAGATVHDFFNLFTVLIFFPIELATGFLGRTAQWIVASLGDAGGWLSDEGGQAGPPNPLKAAVGFTAAPIQWFFRDVIGFRDNLLAAVLFLLALAIVVASLTLITRLMRTLMADRIEQQLNAVLGRSGLLGVAIGIVITTMVQSSSITTSLLVPMFGAGVLTLEAGFPIMVGANIGTTVTALIASSVAGEAGVMIAIVHLLFNTCGTLVFFPVRPMRKIPIYCARRLADLAILNRVWVIVYLALTFIAAPILGILIWQN